MISTDPRGGYLVQFSTTGPGWKCSHQCHRGTDLFATHATSLPPQPFSSTQIFLPLSPELSSPQPVWQSFIIDPTPPHTSAALPCSLLWVLGNEITISSDP